MDSFLTTEMMIEILERNRSRGTYAEYMEREFGIKISPPKPLTRKQKLQAKWNDYKNRVSRAAQILWRGWYDGEGE